MSQNKSISEVLSEPFPTFDNTTAVIAPFNEEHGRDNEFTKKLNEMVLELVLDFHAWSTARPTHETERTAATLETEIRQLQETEREQEKTRQKLNDFITRIKVALAALTDLGS